MILLRLLSAGKSLMGGQNERSYRLPQTQALPKFGGKKNPFRATTIPEHHASRAEEPETRPACEPMSVSKSEPMPSAAIREEAPAENAVRPAAASPSPSPAARPERHGLVAGVRSVLKKFARPTPAPEAAPANTRPLQGELRLECVRVVRNDLSETDIEIVPRQEKPAPSGREAEPVAVAAEEAGSDTAWSRVSARIFGPNNVR